MGYHREMACARGLLFAASSALILAGCADLSELTTGSCGTSCDGAVDSTVQRADASPDAGTVLDGAADGGVDAACNPATLDTDGHNCGACGHDCQGGACSNGACQPVTLASGQSGIQKLVIDATTLYWTSSNGYIGRLGKDGQGLTHVLSGLQDLAGI